MRYPLGGVVTDSAYDLKERLLYLVNRAAYRHGGESFPVINVYRLE